MLDSRAQRKHIPCRNHFAFANCRAGSRCPYSHTSEAAALYDAVGHALWDSDIESDPVPAIPAHRNAQPRGSTTHTTASLWDRSVGVLDVLQALGSVNSHHHPLSHDGAQHHNRRRPVRREREAELTYDQLSSICEKLGDVDVPAKDWKKFLLTRSEERKLKSEAQGCVRNGEGNTCPICLDDCLVCGGVDDEGTLASRPSVEILAAPEQRTLLLPCRHMMHRNCGEEYFRRKHVCPVCREDLNNPAAKKPTI